MASFLEDEPNEKTGLFHTRMRFVSEPNLPEPCCAGWLFADQCESTCANYIDEADAREFFGTLEELEDE